MKRLLIVDANNIAFRHFIKMQESNMGQLTNMEGVPTTVIFGILRTLDSFIKETSIKIDNTYLIWDGGSKYRKKLYPYYKAHREEKEWVEKYYEELNTAREYFEQMCINQIQIKGIEADDIIGYLVRKYKNDRPIILSDDKDYFQLFKYKNLRIFRPSSQKIIFKQDADGMLKYNCKLLPKIVAIVGEIKDNIPGCLPVDVNNNHVPIKCRLGAQKVLKYLYKEDGNIKTLKEFINTYPENDRHYEIIQENKNNIFISYKLSRIRDKEKYYKKWELKKIKKAMKNFNKSIKQYKIDMISDFLEFKTINLIKILKEIGVNVK